MPAALAFDYDGTLATEGRVSPDTEACLRQLKRTGHPLILVTGRILAELEQVCPPACRLFDRIVGENGAVLAAPGEPPRALGPRIPDTLSEALRDSHVPVQRGEVILATLTEYEAQVVEAIAKLGIECARIRNRESLMLLPPGCSKKTGVEAAFAELQIDAREAVGFGDAENDRELFAACGTGVAVANAVPELKAIAKIVLPAPNGEGIRAYLERMRR